MYSIPDYAGAGDLVASWIATGLAMTPGQNMFRDPSWPENPDLVVCLYESGGNWNIDTGLWNETLTLAIRAARLVEAHAAMSLALRSALNGFLTCPVPNRKGAVTLTMASGPQVPPRDEDNRAFVVCTLALELHAPFDNGR